MMHVKTYVKRGEYDVYVYLSWCDLQQQQPPWEKEFFGQLFPSRTINENNAFFVYRVCKTCGFGTARGLRPPVHRVCVGFTALPWLPIWFVRRSPSPIRPLYTNVLRKPYTTDLPWIDVHVWNHPPRNFTRDTHMEFSKCGAKQGTDNKKKK